MPIYQDNLSDRHRIRFLVWDSRKRTGSSCEVPVLFPVSQLQTKSNLIYTLSTALLSLSITLLNSNTTNNIKKLQLKN